MARCEQCKKKLGLQEYTCKCKKVFCISHLHAEQHSCTFDYKEEGKEILKKVIDVGPLSEKVAKI
jgi:hypothetical protein